MKITGAGAAGGSIHPIWNFFLLPRVQADDVVTSACTYFDVLQVPATGCWTCKLPQPGLSICTNTLHICTITAECPAHCCATVWAAA